MFTRIDHVVIAVPDLSQATAQFRRLGFNVLPGGAHPGMGTHNAIAFNEEDYLELLAVRDAAEQGAAAARPGSWVAGLSEFIAAGGGLCYVVVQSDDLAEDVRAMHGRGVDVTAPMEGRRLATSGEELRWRLAVLGPRNRLPIFFIEHFTALSVRRSANTGEAETSHPNGVYALERAYVVTRDVQGAAALYAKVLGLPQPAMTKGTVIMSDMAVFQIGATGLGVVQPYADGPAARALEERGPGPFQALYRTKSMGAAARWMQEHGLPPLERGVRNTGEQAMLATPAEACGAYIGFVGPE